MSTVVTKTVVAIANTETVSEIKGDHSPEAIKEQFAAFFPQIETCVSTVKIEDGVKYITFAERLGTKG